MNRCSFCHFNSDSRRLPLETIADFFSNLQRQTFDIIVINGGEPTLHPEFTEIAHFLYKLWKGKKYLQLGTNLRLFEKKTARNNSKLETICRVFDRISIGCDDEHKNIDIVEQLVPLFLQRGLDVSINSMSEFIVPATEARLAKLKMNNQFSWRKSPLSHDTTGLESVSGRGLCKLRREAFLLNCDGNGYFCYEQETKLPVFNIAKITSAELNYYLYDYIPLQKYHFCDYCHSFK